LEENKQCTGEELSDATPGEDKQEQIDAISKFKQLKYGNLFER
jgi:hypothetical protein